MGIPWVLICHLILISPAHAHKVIIFAWAEGETVHTESKFSGGKRVQGGKVEVFDGNGTLLLDGRTDDSGEFSFRVPKIADLHIVLTAGMGHKNSWRLSADELGKGGTATVTEIQARAENVGSGPREDASSSVSGVGMSAPEVEEIVSRQLEEKLRALTKMVADFQHRGPTISDIIGGIGYILGLVGLGAYIRYRKEGKRP